jgi:hypothetical protein
MVRLSSVSYFGVVDFTDWISSILFYFWFILVNILLPMQRSLFCVDLFSRVAHMLGFSMNIFLFCGSDDVCCNIPRFLDVAEYQGPIPVCLITGSLYVVYCIWFDLCTLSRRIFL